MTVIRPGTGRFFSSGDFSRGSRSLLAARFPTQKGREMFGKTKDKLNAKYVEPVQRGITTALVIATAALILALAALMRSVNHAV